MLIKHILRIERERRRLKRDTTPWQEQTGYGAGSKFASKPRTVGDVASQSTTPLWKCLILYWFARRADFAIELGTGLGFSTAYLVAGINKPYSVRSADANTEALFIANDMLNKAILVSNTLYNTDFDDLLESAPAHYNLAYIDGDHTGAALTRYYLKLIPLMAPKSVIIVDDVLWSKDMKQAWDRLALGRRHLRIHDLGIIWLNKSGEEIC